MLKANSKRIVDPSTFIFRFSIVIRCLLTYISSYFIISPILTTCVLFIVCYMFFSLILKGYRRPLDDYDIWDLTQDNSANQVVAQFQEKWQSELRRLPKYVEFFIFEDISRLN